MIIYHENLHYTQKFQKQAFDKGVKLRGYVPDKKI